MAKREPSTDTVQRLREAYGMRLAGASYAVIAEALGFADASSAGAAVRAARERGWNRSPSRTSWRAYRLLSGFPVA
jgi:hypothetical protein